MKTARFENYYCNVYQFRIRLVISSLREKKPRYSFGQKNKYLTCIYREVVITALATHVELEIFFKKVKKSLFFSGLSIFYII